MKHRKIAEFPYRTYLFIISILFILAAFVLNLIISAKWDGKSRYTLVINSSPLGLFTIEPLQKRALFMAIPGNSLLDVPYGYKKFKADSVFDLGQLDHKRKGSLLLKKSIENTYGVFVDGFINLKNAQSSLINTSEDLSKLKSKYFSWVGIKNIIFSKPVYNGMITSDIPFLDLVRLWFSVKSIRTDQLSFINLSSSKIFKEKKWPDGSVIKEFDMDQFDLITGDLFEDSNIRKQRVSIEIVNATDKDGLASQFGRVLSKIGGLILIKSNSDVKEDFACRISIGKKELEEASIVKFLTKSYSCGININSASPEQVDIRIILGEKFLQ